MKNVFDPVFDSTRTFRILLEAASNPGKLFTLPPFDEGPEAAVLLTLLDHEVTFCVIGGEEEGYPGWTNGARSAPLEDADFVLVYAECSAASRMKRGTLERPEDGATAVYVVERLSNSGPLALRLSGPGIYGERTLGVEGISATEVEGISSSREDYPLGADVFLVDGAGQVCGLPRSTRLEVI